MKECCSLVFSPGWDDLLGFHHRQLRANEDLGSFIDPVKRQSRAKD